MKPPLVSFRLAVTLSGGAVGTWCECGGRKGEREGETGKRKGKQDREEKIDVRKKKKKTKKGQEQLQQAR